MALVTVAFCDPGWTDRSDVGGWRPVGNEGDDDAEIGVREHKGWQIALSMTPMIPKLRYRSDMGAQWH